MNKVQALFQTLKVHKALEVIAIWRTLTKCILCLFSPSQDKQREQLLRPQMWQEPEQDCHINGQGDGRRVPNKDVQQAQSCRQCSIN